MVAGIMSAALASSRAAVPDEVRQIRRTGFSVGLATGLYGISYGALATASGLDLWQAMVLSAVLFSGGSQFAFVGVIGGGGSAIGAALASILLGVRNSLYGLALSRVLPRGGWRGAARAQLTIDESAATSASGTTPRPPGPASGPPGCGSTCSGTCSPWPAHW